MTSQSHLTEYDNPQEMWWFLWGQALKSIHFAVPAQVVSYNSRTKRATVQPSLRIVLHSGGERRYPPILDVPILQPAANGLTVLTPIKPGTVVMLLIAERGLDAFKETYRESAPDPTPFLNLKDAVAWAGFGGLSVTPADDEALSIQTEDGTTAITVKPGR